MLIVVSRIVLAVIGGLGAYQAAAALPLDEWFSTPWRYGAWAAIVVAGVLVGLLLGGLLGRMLRDRMRAIDRAADRRSAAELIVGALGLVVGLVAAALAGVAVAQLPIIGPYLLLPVVLVVAYVFSRVAARKHVDILRLVGIRSRGASDRGATRLIDTSAIIDGRLVDVLRTRFLSGPIVIPDFVLEELQKVADSADALKRARGRRGLEIVEELKAAANGGFAVRSGGDMEGVEGVDAKLVRMAQDVGASIVTTDYNLNKVAQIQGVEVLNVNELANALKPAVLPGEPLTVKIIREGREYDQGVAYLQDGTMIVVEGGRGSVGQEVTVEVTSVLQSPSGKMIFSKMPAEQS
ncbi:MAG TPA: TRAM domain-containing protein [Miltoncostaeaceae bacterium]|nr:TRAM domain-containing protein [Miltoncostaeaceae bacterium]